MGSRRAIHCVLVVDDDEHLLTTWKRSIGRERYVLTATNLAAAREAAAERTPDLAIVDLRLGGSSGIEVTRELRRDYPAIKIALCSGYLSVATAVAGVRAGADVVVFKPVTFKEILRALEADAKEKEPPLDETPTLERAQWEHIMRVLADSDGNVSVAARRLGIYRSSLQRRLRKFAPRK